MDSTAFFIRAVHVVVQMAIITAAIFAGVTACRAFTKFQHQVSVIDLSAQGVQSHVRR